MLVKSWNKKPKIAVSHYWMGFVKDLAGYQPYVYTMKWWFEELKFKEDATLNY
jgi:hypothetical protein